MADLENLLLQAAGRTGSPTRTSQYLPSRRQRAGSSYSNRSNPMEDDSDNFEFYNRRKSETNIPQKWKIEPSEHVNEFNKYDSDSEPSIRNDLYKNDADKEELGNMSELHREMILAERGAQIDDYRLKKIVGISSMAKTEIPNTPTFLPSGQSSIRADALNELRAKRMRLQDPDACRRSNDSFSINRHSSLPNRRTILLIDSSESDDDDDDDDDAKERRLAGDIYTEDNSDDLLTSKSIAIGYKDVIEITIRRSNLVKWLTEPFFEEVVAGCFVRLGVGTTHKGPKYKLCIIKNVDATDPNRRYKLDGRTTYKWLNCFWGSESSAARWQIAMVSDSPPTEDEFNEWAQELERNGGRLPYRKEADNKKNDIHRANHFVYSAHTVKKMLEEKKSSRPVNVAAEKDRLRKEIEIAGYRGNEAEAELLRTKLKKMEEMPERVDTKAIRLAEMNRKNRVENFKNASESKPTNTSLKAGEAGYDPFSRRWTRSRNYFSSSNGETFGETNAIATAEGREAKSVNVHLPIAPAADVRSLHDFELEISLEGLNKFGGSQGFKLGFMARKQKIEATVGYTVPENDGNHRRVAITVSDYKRRRGLLSE